jgi:hypothetical protein
MKKLFIVILVVLILILGGFYVTRYKGKEVIKPEPTVKIVKQNDPPFMLNFPNGLIPTKGIINVVDSFRVEDKNSITEQFTYKYVTSDPVSNVQYYFDQYFIKNGFKQGFLRSNKDYFSINAQKDKVSVSVYGEKNKGGSGTLVEISVVK